MPADELPRWLSDNLQARNTDFDVRVVCREDDAQWQPTGLQGVQMRIMEFVPGPHPRLSSQLRFHCAHEPVPIGNQPDLEILVQNGHFHSATEDYEANWYYRLPDLPGSTPPLLECRSTASTAVAEPGLVYLAAGQMKQSDTQWRRINTADADGWFPGPVEGTDVLPLHGHGFGNVMLVRWNRTAAFKTRINPLGEELLVLDGALYDAQGHYPVGSWIRNPITTWQSWGAKAGTVVYYKNGHFADSERNSDPDSDL